MAESRLRAALPVTHECADRPPPALCLAGSVIAAYIACKLVDGMLAVLLAMRFTKGEQAA